MEEMLGCLGAPIWGTASLQLIPELWVLWDGLGFFCPSVLWLCAFILPSGVVEADTDQWERACDTLLMCIVTVLNHGLRNGGGVGDILRKPSKDVSGVPSFCHCRAALPPSKSLPALSPTAVLQCFCPSHPHASPHLVPSAYGPCRMEGRFARLVFSFCPPQESLFPARVVYDLLFFFIVIIIVLNLIFGVIIDTFADLRSEKQKKEEILKTTCFICGECRSLALRAQELPPRCSPL